MENHLSQTLTGRLRLLWPHRMAMGPCCEYSSMPEWQWMRQTQKMASALFSGPHQRDMSHACGRYYAVRVLPDCPVWVPFHECDSPGPGAWMSTARSTAVMHRTIVGVPTTGAPRERWRKCQMLEPPLRSSGS